MEKIKYAHEYDRIDIPYSEKSKPFYDAMETVRKSIIARWSVERAAAEAAQEPWEPN